MATFFSIVLRQDDDGRVEIDSNIVQRAIRPIALTRKNALFAGSDNGAETIGQPCPQVTWTENDAYKQHHATVGRQATAVEIGCDFLGSNG